MHSQIVGDDTPANNFKHLEQRIAEHKRDRDGLNSELDAVLEYDAKLKTRCIGKPESYDERKACQEADIEGPKEALKLRSADDCVAQRGSRALRRASIVCST